MNPLIDEKLQEIDRCVTMFSQWQFSVVTTLERKLSNI